MAVLLGIGPLAARASAYSLLASSSADRSSPAPLQGKTVGGDIYVFVSPTSGVSQVRFYLDDPARAGGPIRTEAYSPWDFAATSSDTAKTAKPYDSKLLANGQHTITAAIDKSAGGADLISSSFTVSNTAGVTPTQWVAKTHTEAQGQSPSPESWNSEVAYWADHDCNVETLKTVGKAAYTASDFLDLGYDNAAKLLALYRGALNREPRESDLTSSLRALDDGSVTWPGLVGAVFDSAEFATLATAICDSNDPNYSFSSTPPGDLRQWAYGTPSRTQEEVQVALDDAQATCGIVELEPEEVIFIGGDQPGTDSDNSPLRIPPCVTLRTAGSPDPHHYAGMGRLVPNGPICDSSRCDHVELVRLGDGATLANVWVDGRGSDPGNEKIALVGARSGQTPTEITDNRLSDPPPNGTAVRVEGYDTSGEPCSDRVVSGNLITGYASRYASSRQGKAQGSDGISVFCEQATVQNNELVDISGMGIVVHGSWNSATEEQGTQRSTVSGNQVISAGISARVALGADAVGECLAERDGPPVDCIEFSHDSGGSSAERSFAGTSIAGNTFWTGSRTHFDIGLMVGSKLLWGDNGPFARGASFTDNTTGDVSTTRVNTGIAVSGMFDADLRGNTTAVDAADTNSAVTEGKCPPGGVLFGSGLAGFAPGSQLAGEASGLYGCLADHPAAQGLEQIELGPNRTFVGKDSGERFIPWGHGQAGRFDHKVDPFDLREIKQMGSDVFRLHLQFKDIMESCTSANPTALDELGDTLRRAEENGIYLDLTGLSSYAGDDQDPSCYRDATEEERWSAQAAFWRAVAKKVANSSAVFALDIMNEPVIPAGETKCWAGPAPADQPRAYCHQSFGGYYFRPNITRTPNGRSAAEIGRAWVVRMRDAIRAYDSEHLITLGCLPYSKCLGLNPTDMAALLDYLSVHIYPRDCTGPPPPSGPDPCRADRSLENSSGDPLTGERKLLAAYASGGDPVVVEETFPLVGSPESVRNFILDSRPYATGWLGHWGDSTISQERAASVTSRWYFWGQVFQRLTSTVTATSRTTATSVNCAPSSVPVDGSATCTATVSDSGSQGKAVPAGTVSFLAKGAGSFSSGAACSLSPTGSESEASCSVTYTPTAPGTHTITGGYGGDITDSASSVASTVTVTRRTAATSR